MDTKSTIKASGTISGAFYEDNLIGGQIENQDNLSGIVQQQQYQKGIVHIEDNIKGYVQQESNLKGVVDSDFTIVGVINYYQSSSDFPTYRGPYIVTPTKYEQLLETQNKVMKADVKVKAIPYYETSNQSGTTVYIANEV